jgi:hypothetical protein
MKTFEYVTTSTRMSNTELNDLGKQGFELVAVHPDGKLFFKRELESSPRQEPRKNLTPSYGMER